jgi:hypothetical protein
LVDDGIERIPLQLGDEACGSAGDDVHGRRGSAAFAVQPIEGRAVCTKYGKPKIRV